MSDDPQTTSLNQGEGPVELQDTSNPASRPSAQNLKVRFPTYVLIMGPSGSGKSTLINAVSNEQVAVAPVGSGPCTTEFGFLQHDISGQSYRLVDTPGLNTRNHSDADIFKQMINYLFRIHVRPHGILYLEPEDGSTIPSKLKQNLEAIQGLFGRSWMPNVIVAVVGRDTSSNLDATLSPEDPTSPLHSFHTAGTRFRKISLLPTDIQGVLTEFDSGPPKTPKFYLRARPRHLNGRTDFKALDYLINEIFPPRRLLQNSSGNRQRRTSVEDSETLCRQLQLALDKSDEEIKSLRAQLEQTRLEYGSLRSELQLQDNTEQMKVVQSLKDLTRRIEDFSRLVAQYLVDDYIAPNSQDPENVTALQAIDLTDLKLQVGHEDGLSSLVVSASGVGMQIEDFFDLALRSIICRRLYNHVFLPFHPIVTSPPEVTFINSLYEGVRRQSPQVVAAKWRANSFTALSKDKGAESRREMIESHVQGIMADISKPINSYFGRDKGVSLTEEQRMRLAQIVNSAWDWNDMLKGEVVTLGNFQPTFYEPGTPFDPEWMMEFESSRRAPSEKTICTIGLGLSLSRPKSQGEVAEPTTVLGANVLTEHFYTRS